MRSTFYGRSPFPDYHRLVMIQHTRMLASSSVVHLNVLLSVETYNKYNIKLHGSCILPVFLFLLNH